MVAVRRVAGQCLRIQVFLDPPVAQRLRDHWVRRRALLLVVQSLVETQEAVLAACLPLVGILEEVQAANHRQADLALEVACQAVPSLRLDQAGCQVAFQQSLASALSAQMERAAAPQDQG